MEHYVTLFDSRFLPLGLALHASLQKVSPNSYLWVICVDELVEQQLNRLNLMNLSTISLKSIETIELLSVKSDRTVGEYCWTLAPFAPEAVFNLAPNARRVTYLDTDLFFLSSPKSIFDEFELSGKHVLMTEHAYAPEHDRTEKSGRFCCQYITFCRSSKGYEVMKWWQARCIEWCFDRLEDGKFGDQKYLEQWPILFPDSTHILSQVEKLLAPWNVDYFLKKMPNEFLPILYHFQSFRIIDNNRVRLYTGVPISHRADRFYRAYLACIIENIKLMTKNNIPLLVMPEPNRRFSQLRKLYMRLSNRVRYDNLSALT